MASNVQESIRKDVDLLEQKAKALPPSLLVFTAFAAGSATTLAGAFVYRRFFRRIPNGDWVTPDILAKKRWVKGRVTSVGDNDNFRLYHTPSLGWSWPLKFRRIPSTSKALKGKTIHIRMAGVDAPEAAHFGFEEQPYAEEALAWLKSQVEGKTVYCQLIRRDQYSRVVAVPHLKPRFLPAFLAKGKCVSLEMLRDGWAITYEQAGAEYGKWGKEEFLRIQAEAQAARRGMWEKGITGETPAQYKQRHAALLKAPKTDRSPTESGKASASSKSVESRSKWKRLFARL